MPIAPTVGLTAWYAVKTAVKATLAAVAVLVLSACSSLPISPTDTTNNQAGFVSVHAFENMSSTDWQKALTPVFERARISVQNETDTNLDHVTFAVVPNSIIEREVAKETGRLAHSQFTEKRFADHFLDSVMAGQAGTYAALYSTNNQQVMVSKDLLTGYVKSVGDDALAIKHALNALLIHELVHAADDTRYGIHRNRDLNFRASFTQSAIYEGHAQYITRRICQKSDCSSGLQSLDQFMFGDKLSPNQLVQPVQAISRNVLEYSYVEGERFISSLARRSDGKALVQSALVSPPIDPIQILDPSSFPNDTRTALNDSLIHATSGISHPWTEAPWVQVETSPLKGVNLRSDPARRVAAVDGFTRLIQGMVAFQHYNQADLNASPVELTLMGAEDQHTAELFAQSLTKNLIYNSGGHATEEILWLSPEIPPESLIAVNTVLDDGRSHLAMVVSHEQYVLQLVAVDVARDTALDYAKEVLVNLSSSVNLIN